MIRSMTQSLPNVNPEVPSSIRGGYTTPDDTITLFSSPPTVHRVSDSMTLFVDDVQFAPLLPDLIRGPCFEENRPPYFKIQPRYGSLNVQGTATSPDPPGVVPSYSFSESSNEDADEVQEDSSTTTTMVTRGTRLTNESLASLSSMQATRQERLDEALDWKVSPKKKKKKKNTSVKVPTPQRPTTTTTTTLEKQPPRRNSLNALAA